MKKQKKEANVTKKNLVKLKRRQPNRSRIGDFIIYFFLILVALMMVFPLVFAINNALKPLDELFMFPPKVFAQNPTLDNFSDLFVTMGKSWVTFPRYVFNTVFITVVGTAGHLILASMAAFVLAKYDFPGGKTFFKLVTVALMFSGYITAIPNYLIINELGWIDTYWAIIIPAFASPMGLFLMKQFMEGLPMSPIEAAKIDGANEWKVFISIVMPNVKPAWLTMIIFSVQGLWNNQAATFIYSEEKKTLVYALQQIQSGGIARTGQAAAVTVVVMAVPILIFILSESQILEEMGKFRFERLRRLVQVMKKTMKRLSALLIGMMIALSSAMAVYADEGYTYNYDYWEDIQYSPDAYEVSGVYSAVDFGLETGLKTPSGLFVYEDMIYICDTGNNRILEIEETGSQTLELIRVIDSFKGGEGPETFSSPQDVAVTDDGYIFIADTNNSRILKLDMDLNYVMEFTKPVDATFDQDLSFLPYKLAIDTAGRVYCVATNVNKGLIKFEADGEFSGFIGATEVTYDWTDYIWKRFATQAQREQMESFVPTEYDNIYMDYEGFIYACTTHVTKSTLEDGTADPIRRLNMMGSDILIRTVNGILLVISIGGMAIFRSFFDHRYHSV